MQGSFIKHTYIHFGPQLSVALQLMSWGPGFIEEVANPNACEIASLSWLNHILEVSTAATRSPANDTQFKAIFRNCLEIVDAVLKHCRIQTDKSNCSTTLVNIIKYLARHTSRWSALYHVVDKLLEVASTDSDVTECVHTVFHLIKSVSNIRSILPSTFWARAKRLRARSQGNQFVKKVIPQSCEQNENIKQPIDKTVPVDLNCNQVLSFLRQPKFWNSSDLSEKYRIVSQLGLLACEDSHHLMNKSDGICRLCNSGQQFCQLIDPNRPIAGEFNTLLDKIVAQDSFLNDEVLRITCLKSIRRIWSSYQPPTTLYRGTDSLYFVISSLRSNSRPIRLNAAHILPTLICVNDPAVQETNFKYMAAELQSLYSASLNGVQPEYISETVLIAWGQLARVCNEELLNFVCIQLVDALGQSYLSSVAITEIRAASKARNKTPYDLLFPFWPTVTLKVVRKSVEVPTVLNAFCRLVTLSVSRFARSCMPYVVPYLVADLAKPRDSTQSLALLKDLARVADMDAKTMFFNNSVSTIAVLLDQAPRRAQSVWQNLDPSFRDVEWSQMISVYLLDIGCEILKLGRDVSRTLAVLETYKVSYFFPLFVHFVSSSLLYTNQPFFVERNMAPVVLKLSVDMSRTALPESSKLACLAGLRSMLQRIQTDEIASALSQVCTLLQSALDHDYLQVEAIQTWLALLQKLGAENLKTIVILTISVIAQKFNALVFKARKEAKDMILWLYSNHQDSLHQVMADYGLPDLGVIDDHLVFEGNEKRSIAQTLNGFILRCLSDNVYVVRQTLQELHVFLRRTHDERADMSSYEFYSVKVNQILRQVGDLPEKFPNDSRVPLLAARCLGEIGGLATLANDDVEQLFDSDDKTASSSIQRKPVIVKENFLEKKESIEFVQVLIENFLVRSYVGAVDTNRQLFAAYGIQELLKFCGSEVLESLSTETYMVVAPLQNTRYSTGEYNWRQNVENGQVACPIYRPGIPYELWLRQLTYNIIDQLKGQNSRSIFNTIRIITRDFADSTPVLEFCLPYVVLCVVLESSSVSQNGPTPSPNAIVSIVEEFLTVLQAKKKPSESQFIQRLFAIVDYFRIWQRLSGSVDTETGVNAILDRLPLDELADCALSCASYARAALYWEQYLRETKDENIQADVLSKLQEIYARLDDPDTLEGIATKLPNFAFDQLLLHYESAGRWEDALACWDFMAADDIQSDDKLRQKHLNCLVQCEKYQDIMTICRESTDPPYRAQVFCVEGSWLSGDWKELGYWLQRTGDCFETSTGRALQCVKEGSQELFDRFVANAQILLVNQNLVNNGSMSTPLQLFKGQAGSGTSVLLKLRALQEVEIIGQLWLAGQDVTRDEFTRALKSLTSTLSTQSYDAMRYILSVRRAVIRSTAFPFVDEMIGDTLIATAKCLRKQERYKPALRAVFNAMQLIKGNGDANIVPVVNEYAKVLWDQGDQRQAVSVLEKVLPPDFIKKSTTTDSTSLNVALRYTAWLDELGQSGSTELISKYRCIAVANERWEKPHFLLAKHLTKQYSAEQLLPEPRRNESFRNGELVHSMVRSYVKVLSYGVKHVYEALPRLVTTWLDFAEDVDSNYDVKPQHDEPIVPAIALKKIHKLLSLQHIPNYVLFMALPQMLSRITHSNLAVVETLIALIVDITAQYLSQALWYVSGVVNSTQSTRSKRGNDILSKLVRKVKRDDLRAQSKSQAQVKSSLEVIQSLIYLCKAPVDGGYRDRKCQLSDFIGSRDSDHFRCDLVVPVERLLAVNLPSSPTNLKHHKPFQDPGKIFKILPDVAIQHSMQKPKRITVCATDGIIYKLLLKPKDDSRKDARLLQLTSTLARFLKVDPTSSRRSLSIKTYHVTPLNEENGVIEWVDGAIPLRTVLDRFLSRKRKGFSLIEIREKLANKSVDLETRQSNYRKIIKANPPVLHEWFVETFPNPENWLSARTKFTRSCAVMSIVGYILGLGDRHCDNILILRNGGILHVDFDCLFDKGLSLEIPERVPFRLTPNIVDAFGFTSYEGSFRKAAEVTLAIMRGNGGTLKTMLETFLHDPIVEWSRTARKRRAPTIVHGLKTARSPQEALQAVENKVAGLVGSNSINLSVPGQVDYLIRLATSVENLSQMYIGWAPYL